MTAVEEFPASPSNSREDWGKNQTLITLGLFIFIVAPCWWVLSAKGFRWIKSKAMPDTTRCQYIPWGSISGTGSGLHVCRISTGWVDSCSLGRHITGGRCWESIKEYFGINGELDYVPKPEGLSGEYLCVDRDVLLALILCAVEDGKEVPYRFGKPIRPFNHGGVSVTVHKAKGSNVVVAHFVNETKTCERNLNKSEAANLLSGYPPFWREKIQYNDVPIQSQVNDVDDLIRGGWIVGAGFSDFLPIPLYIDRPGRTSQVRTALFIEARKRVLEILNVLRSIYPDDCVLEKTTKAVVEMIKNKSDSSKPERLDNAGTLTPAECVRAMQLFNLGPTATEEQKDTIFRPFFDTTRVLHVVASAAYRGVHRTFKYCKNSGRELNYLIPENLQTVYICEVVPPNRINKNDDPGFVALFSSKYNDRL